MVESNNVELALAARKCTVDVSSDAVADIVSAVGQRGANLAAVQSTLAVQVLTSDQHMRGGLRLMARRPEG